MFTKRPSANIARFHASMVHRISPVEHVSLYADAALSTYSAQPAPGEDTRQDYVRDIAAMRCYARYLLADIDAADDLVHVALNNAVAARRDMPAPPLRKLWLLLWVPVSLYDDRSARSAPATQETASVRDTSGSGVSARNGVSETHIALHTLTRQQRELIFFITVQRFTYAEAAAVLDLPVSAIDGAMAAARASLCSAVAGLTPRMQAGAPQFRSA